MDDFSFLWTLTFIIFLIYGLLLYCSSVFSGGCVKSDDKTLVYLLLPYKEGPCDQTDFIFEIAEYNYVYTSSYFTYIMCFVYLQFSYAI